MHKEKEIKIMALRWQYTDIVTVLIKKEPEAKNFGFSKIAD